MYTYPIMYMLESMTIIDIALFDNTHSCQNIYVHTHIHISKFNNKRIYISTTYTFTHIHKSHTQHTPHSHLLPAHTHIVHHVHRP